MSVDNEKKQIGTRVAHLPRLAKEVFKLGKQDQRVRTVMMKVDLSDDALSRFAPFSVDAEESKKRLNYLADQWTGAIQHMLTRVREDLFEKRRDVLLSVAVERDYDAAIAHEKGWLEITESVFELGTSENPLTAKVCHHFKIGKEMVKPGTDKARSIICAMLSDSLFLKLVLEEDDEDANLQRFAVKKFDAQNLGGFLSAAYWSGLLKLQKKPYKFGFLGEEYARSNNDRTRNEWLKDNDFAALVGESVRQKVAENICGFLEKYYSVQPTVNKHVVSTDNVIKRTKSFLNECSSDFDDAQLRRLSDWKDAADKFIKCDASDPNEVAAYQEWIHEYNMRLNELCQVLPKDWFEEEGVAHQKRALDKLDSLKGYPTWPDYKTNTQSEYEQRLGILLDEIGELSVDFDSTKSWVDEAYLDSEVRRLDYVGDRKPKFKRNVAKVLPLRVRTAREVFARTGGHIVERDGKHEIVWKPDSRRLTEVMTAVTQRLRNDINKLTNHFRTSTGEGDFLARRHLVDVLVVLANLKASGMPKNERPRFLSRVNRLAGEIKGSLLKLAEGSKHEIQISGFSGDPKKTGGWSLKKNASLLVEGEPGQKEKIAILFDPSGEKKNGITIAEKAGEHIRGIVYSGGSDRRDLDEEDKERVLCSGSLDGRLGDQGVILPLQLGSSQARRYFYPKNGHIEDGIVGAMTTGVNIMSGRIIRKVNSEGVTEFFAALSIGLPQRIHDHRTVKPSGFIGVDRGETYLAVFAETDSEGHLVNRPLPYGDKAMRRTMKAYGKMKHSQSQAKRLIGGNWFEARIKNAVRLIAVKATEMMLTERKAIVFEDLSRGFARGGTASWEHQYTKVEDHLKDVLGFSGVSTKEIYHFTDKNKDKGYSWFGKVGAAYTSQTCPSCGSIWSKAKIDRMRQEPVVVLSWDNGRGPRPGVDEVQIKLEAEKWLMAVDDRKIDVTKEIGRNCSAYVSEPNKSSDKAKRAARQIMDWFTHRPRNNYDLFRCRYCDVQLHADMVGALNIARKAIFQQSHPVEKRKRADWQKWYLERLNDGKSNWWNDAVKEWLKP